MSEKQRNNGKKNIESQIVEKQKSNDSKTADRIKTYHEKQKSKFPTPTNC